MVTTPRRTQQPHENENDAHFVQEQPLLDRSCLFNVKSFFSHFARFQDKDERPKQTSAISRFRNIPIY